MKNNMKRKIKYIWKFAKPYKWSFLNAFLCILFTSIISMIYPYVFGLLVDEVFYDKNLKFFIIIIIGYVIIYFTEQMLHLILNILWPYQFNVYLLDIRKEVYRKIISLKYQELINMPVGDMIGKINWQSEAFVELIHRNLAYLFANTIKLVTITVIVMLINYKLSVLLLFFIPISYLVSYKLGKKVGEKQKGLRDSYMGFLGWIFEILGGIREIKLFGAEKNVTEKCSLMIKDINNKNVQVAKMEVISGRICAFIALATNIGLYIIAGVLVYLDEISLGSFIAVIAYFEMANSLLGSINRYWGNIHGNNVNIDKLVNLFEKESEGNVKANNINIIKGHILLKNVTFSYGEKQVLKQLNLTISPGENVALVGKSGTGKTTIVNLLIRLLNTDKGEIIIDNQNINDYSITSIREQIGIVQQEIYVFQGTIRDNLLLANSNASDDDLLEALKNAGLNEYLNKLDKGLDTLLGQNGIIMSGGEQQRLAIARLFLKDTKILIFDEATSSLDSETENHINKAWKRLSTGKTSIIIAHRLSTILNADRIAILDDGIIVGYDTHDKLYLENEQYRKLFKEQYFSKEKVIGR